MSLHCWHAVKFNSCIYLWSFIHIVLVIILVIWVYEWWYGSTNGDMDLRMGRWVYEWWDGSTNGEMGLRMVRWIYNVIEWGEVDFCWHSLSYIWMVCHVWQVCLKDEEFLSGLDWHTLVVDEGHRLKNRQSLLHQALRSVSQPLLIAPSL